MGFWGSESEICDLVRPIAIVSIIYKGLSGF